MRMARLVELVRRWARGGVDFIQIREKDLSGEDLVSLVKDVVDAVREEQNGTRRTKVLVNGSAEIAELALEAGADGVHLPGNVAAQGAEAVREAIQRVRAVFAGLDATVGVSCHMAEEAAQAEGASLILFAPVFEKRLGADEAIAGQGLAALGTACRTSGEIPVLALGGVTAENAQACLQAGAAGIAGIRLFLEDGWQSLRSH